MLKLLARFILLFLFLIPFPPDAGGKNLLSSVTVTGEAAVQEAIFPSFHLPDTRNEQDSRLIDFINRLCTSLLPSHLWNTRRVFLFIWLLLLCLLAR